jgi:small ligand-binding sensory domain FIST
MSSVTAALSSHPVPALAVGEVVGQALERGGAHADLALLLVSSHHAGALEDAAAVVRHLIRPSVLIGVSAPSVTANAMTLGSSPAVVLHLATTGLLAPVMLPQDRLGDWRSLDPAFTVMGGLLFAREVSASHGPWLARLRESGPFPLLGAMLDDAAPMVLNDEVYDASVGAVGVVLGAGSGTRVRTVSATRKVGPRLEVTEAGGHTLRRLAGAPALHQLLDLTEDGMAGEDARLLEQGVFLSVGTSEGERLYAVVGADAATGSIVCSGPVTVGERAQFSVMDRAAAERRLQTWEPAWRANGGLLFSALPEHRAPTTARRGEVAVLTGPGEAGGLSELRCRAVLDQGRLRRPAIGAVLFGAQDPAGGDDGDAAPWPSEAS